jgi:hypothetical protein
VGKKGQIYVWKYIGLYFIMFYKIYLIDILKLPLNIMILNIMTFLFIDNSIIEYYVKF